MKKFALICLFSGMALFAYAQNAETKETPQHGAKIRFETMEHNYGTIQKGGNGDCEFTFINEGDEPLILQTVKASCGCTTPSYTQKPVMPGQTGSIKVHYNTNNVGGFSKTVTVTSNAVNNNRVVLRIKGTVQQDAAPKTTPENAPVVVPEKKEPAAEGMPAKPEMKKELVVKPTSKARENHEANRLVVEKAEEIIEMTPERKKNIDVLNEGLRHNKMQLNSAEMEISGNTVDAIKHLAEDMEANPDLRIMVTGHTCNTGSSAANMQVGMKRAQAAKALLVGYGVPADRIGVQSKGDTEPAFSNDTEEGRMKNRRVVIEYVK